MTRHLTAVPELELITVHLARLAGVLDIPVVQAGLEHELDLRLGNRRRGDIWFTHYKPSEAAEILSRAIAGDDDVNISPELAVELAEGLQHVGKAWVVVAYAAADPT